MTERDWRDDQFDRADFDQEYGVLAYTLREIQKATRPTTTAMQNFVAREVRKKFEAAHEAYKRSYDPNSTYNQARTYGQAYKGPMEYEEYFARNRAAYLDVLSQPIDLKSAAHVAPPLGGPTTAELFPTAFQQSTVGDAMNWLTTTELPGLLNSIAKPIYGEAVYERNPDNSFRLDQNGERIVKQRAPMIFRQASNLPADEINAGWQQMFDTIHLYKPGSDFKNNFTIWANANAAYGIEDHRKAERLARGASIPMSFALGDDGDGDDEPGGGLVNQMTGEWGDYGNSALDTASEIGNASRFMNISVRPHKTAWGIDWSVPGGKRRNAQDFINSILNPSGKDIMGEYSKLNVQTGMVETPEGTGGYGQARVSGWMYGIDPANVQVFGIDPKSPAGLAGMKQGAYVQSLQRLLSHPQLADIVDELFHETNIQLPVMQPDDKGNLVEQLLNINAGPMSGRGLFEDGIEEEPHFMERLADMLDPTMGHTVYTKRQDGRKGPNGETLYDKSTVGSTSGIPTQLYTTDERASAGMWRDDNGTWRVSNMTAYPDEAHQIPVTISAEAMKNFAPIYDRFSKDWRTYDQAYRTASTKAWETVNKRYRKSMLETGRYPEQPIADAARDLTLKLLPASVPQPGTPVFDFWQSSSGMLKEIRNFEDQMAGAAASGEEFYGRTIEQWDAYASSMERYRNPGVYGYIDPKRLALAQREVSGAGNYLANQRQAHQAGLMARLNPEMKGTLQYPPPEGMADGARVNGSGGARLGKTLRPDPLTGEFRKIYPEVAMSRFYLNQPRGPLPPTPRKTLAQQAADRELYYTVQQAPVQGNPAGSAFDLSGLSQQTDNAYMFPRSPGRAKRLNYALYTQRRAGEPAPDFQGNPTTGPILPARPTGKYKDPAPRPWHQPPGPNEFVSPLDPSFSLSRMASDENYAGQVFSAGDRFAGVVGEGSINGVYDRETRDLMWQTYQPEPGQQAAARTTLTEAAYSHISNKNAMSAFPVGSMNEDDFEWTTADPRPREEKPTIENTFDTSVMGGDPENMVESDENLVGMRDTSQFQVEGYFKPYKMEGAGVDVLGMLQGDKLGDLNKMNLQANMDGNAMSLDALNAKPKNDPVMALRQKANGRSERDELRDITEEVDQAESDASFNNALRVLDDPYDPNASLSAQISQAGNELGFLDHSKANWGAIFKRWSSRETRKESNQTYHALNNSEGRVDQEIEKMSRELTANISSLEGAGKKRAVMLTRLGEMDHEGRGPELAQLMAQNTRKGARHAQYYRQTLQQISREYKLNLAWQPGKEAELYDQVEALRVSNPEAYAAVKSIYADLPDQLKLSRQYVEAAMTNPATTQKPTGNTPPPQRGQSAGDSHVFRGPDGKGRAMLKYSPNQIEEMSRGRGAGINPETGEFDPFSLENTPVANQVAARGGGGYSRGAWSRPDYQDLNALQNSIAYRHFSNRQGDNQRARLEGQVQTYKDEYIDKRKRFDLIMPYDPDQDQQGAGLEAMLQEADSAVRSAFGAGFDIGTMEEVSDPDLPAGFVRIGSTVRREGEEPEYVNDFVNDRDPGEPPEAPPPPSGGGTGSSGGGNNGNSGQPPEPPPPPPDPSDSNGTPRPNRSNGSGRTSPARSYGRTPKPKPNSDPAAFPMTPGGEGWKMTFSRYDPSTRKGKSVSVWGRRDDQGNLGWYERNAEGNMEPLQINKGWGKIYDEKGTLLHDVDRNARDYYDAMNAPMVSSAGNSPAAGNNTATPARQIIRTPEEWASFTPEAGMMMVDRSSGYAKHYFAVEDPDNAGQMKWVTSAKEGGIQEDARNPGWGQIIAPDGAVVADVPQHKYEIYANEQGLERSARNKQLREQARAEGAARQAEAQAQRRVAQSSPSPSISGFSASFGRFNNSMWGISGRFMSRFLQSHSPQEFGETEIGENTKLAAANEYLAQATHIYNSYVDNSPTSAQQIIDDIVDMTGADESVAKPIAEALYGEHQEAKRRRVPLKKQNPMRRSMERAGRLSDEYDSQDIGAGPLGMRTHVQSKVGDVSVRDIDGFKSPSLGEGHYTGYVDERGEHRWVPRIAIDKTNPLTGERGLQTTVDQTQIAKGLGWAQNAFNSAFSGDLPSSPDAILATLKERMYTEMSKQMKADIDNAVKHGANRTDAGVAAQVTKEVGDHFIQKIVGKVKDALGVTAGEVDSSAVAEGTRYDHRIRSMDELKGKLGSDPVFAAEFKGRSAEDIHSGDEMVVYDGNGRSLKVGGSGDDHYGTKSRNGSSAVSGAGNSGENLSGTRGMFGKGSAGSIMYGAYMLKREWQMATGATFAAATAYGEGIADYSGLMYSGSPMGGSDVGFAYRQEAGESFMGKAAYSQWGAFMDIPYRLSETGNMGAARLLQTAGIAGGLAMGGAIGGSMLAGTALAAAAPVLATGGLVLGGALLAGTAAMEAYNAFNPEDAPDLTLSSIVSETEKETARQSARARRKEALYGAQTAPSGVEMSAFMLAGGSQPHSPAGQSAAWAARTEMNKYDNNKFVTDEELMEYMTPEEKQLWIDEEMNKKAEELSSQVKKIRGDTLEDKNTLIKGLSAQKWYMGSPDPQMLGQVSAASAMIGVGSDQSITEGATYSQQLGYLQGTPDFTRAMYQYALTGNRTQRQQMQYTASRVNQFGSQIQAMMGTSGNFAGQGARIAQTYDFQTQAQVGAYTSMVGGMQAYGAELAPWQYDSLANLSQSNNPFVSQVLGNAMEGFMMAGGSAGGAVDLGWMMSGMSTQDASVYGRMMQGDLKAYSYQAWQSGNTGNMFFDKAGRSITQYYGAETISTSNTGLPSSASRP